MAPTEAALPVAHDAFTAAALRIVLHRLANASHWLGALAAVARGEDAARLLERHADELARTARELDDEGIAFALIARALGADTERLRQSARAARVALDLAREAARREGRSIAEPRAGCELPREIDAAWTIACFLFDCALSQPPEKLLEWSIETAGHETVVRVEIDAPADWTTVSARAACVRSGPGCTELVLSI